VILETATKKECPKAYTSPRSAIRARMKAVGMGAWILHVVRHSQVVLGPCRVADFSLDMTIKDGS